jgi:hypothetical protein
MDDLTARLREEDHDHDQAEGREDGEKPEDLSLTKILR